MPQHTTDGQPVEVVDVGMANTDAGPDFFNAKIKINGTLWAGNVEIHVRSSEWKRHGHQTDKAYDNVILHVVKIADTIVQRTNESAIPQCELHYPQSVEEKFEQWLHSKQKIACADEMAHIPDIFISDWKNSLLTERLESKTQEIDHLLTQSENHWEEVFYRTLAHSFGFHINGQAFELLAKSLPLTCLAKHKNNLFQLEAMLFGQSGLLENAHDPYAEQLKKEYTFLRQKFGLQPLEASQWKLLRLRPANFPYVRIAQFAALLYRSEKLFSKLLDCKTTEQLTGLFDIQAGSYWDTHCRFDDENTRKTPKKLGKRSINILLINTVIPCLFAYGRNHNDDILQERALEMLQQLPAEQNAVIEQWETAGIRAQNAADTQALLQLRHHYCNEKRCLQCRIGHQLFKHTRN